MFYAKRPHWYANLACAIHIYFFLDSNYDSNLTRNPEDHAPIIDKVASFLKNTNELQNQVT